MTAPERQAPDDPLAALLRNALAHHRRGELAQAEALYRQALTAAPRRADVLHMLGLLQYQTGHPEDALALIQRAIAIDPAQASAHSNLALVWQKLGRADAALASSDAALALQPDYPEALNNRGIALYDLQRFADALTSYDRALALRPSYAEAHYNRGAALERLQRLDDALQSYDRALALAPRYAAALNNRGRVLQQLRRYDQALASYDQALALSPDFAEAANNRGNALLELQRFDAALADYERALRVQPGRIELLANRATALYTARRYDEAAAAYDEVLAKAPDHPYALGNLLGCRLNTCDWRDVVALTATVDARVAAGARAIVPFTYLAAARSPAAQLRCARTYIADRFPARPALWTGQRYRHDRIRVAYLSADFHEHATAYLLTELFELHDRSAFEVMAVSYGPADDSRIRKRLEHAFERFVDVRTLSDAAVAAMLRDAEIDILVDLKGFTFNSRLGIAAYRPAPVQVAYMGSPSTLGADFIDYIVADDAVIPPGEDAFYAERVVRLPDTYFVHDARRDLTGTIPTRTAAGLPPSGFVFCCFNNNYKITPDVFEVWMRLLVEVPGSVLWLLESNAAAPQNLRREAARHGVGPERLVFAPKLPVHEHLARQRLADLSLDTLPCNAHTTATDALWLGVPHVTCRGSTFAGRVAASLLNALGMPELIAESLPEYERLAQALANDPGRLAEARARLGRQRESAPLFDTNRFRRHLEAAYRTMWEIHQRGNAPTAITVPALD